MGFNEEKVKFPKVERCRFHLLIDEAKPSESGRKWTGCGRKQLSLCQSWREFPISLRLFLSTSFLGFLYCTSSFSKSPKGKISCVWGFRLKVFAIIKRKWPYKFVLLVYFHSGICVLKLHRIFFNHNHIKIMDLNWIIKYPLFFASNFFFFFWLF